MKSQIQILFKTVLLLTICCSLNTAFAQAPEKMSYQAIIRNASNTLMTNQAVGMRVSILQGSATGTEVYKELFNPNPQTNSNGLVTVEIGTGIPLTGTFAGINWANGPYFIKTETDPTGGTSYTIVGTSQLMSVPYALYAAKSGNTGWGLSGNAGTNANTNFIGTTDNQDVVFKRNNANAGRISNGNTSFGLNALNSNTTGNKNTSTGAASLYSNTTGVINTANGSFALNANTTGNSNTATGGEALYSNTTGNDNSAFGTYSLRENTTGSRNAVFGRQALHANTIGTGNTAIGINAIYQKTIGDYNVGVGADVIKSLLSGSFNVAIGSNCMYDLISGSNNIGIGTNANVPSSTGSNQVRIGDTSITYAGTQVAWSVTSDKRWKENITPSNLGLTFINDLKPVFYTRKNDETKKVEYGIIAQELEASLEKFGANTNGIITKDDEGMYSVRYNDLLAPMIKAIQEQQVMIEELKAEIQTLKSKK